MKYPKHNNDNVRSSQKMPRDRYHETLRTLYLLLENDEVRQFLSAKSNLLGFCRNETLGNRRYKIAFVSIIWDNRRPVKQDKVTLGTIKSVCHCPENSAMLEKGSWLVFWFENSQDR
jgi:hypothetical protein